MKPYICAICRRHIVTEARGGPHPSPGDHDPAPHVARAYRGRHDVMTTYTAEGWQA